MTKSQLKTISVVIPSWNSEKQLKQNLRYVYAAANEVKAEIVIVDDASSYDQSQAYLKKQADLGKIRYYFNKTNQGFSYTVNRGVKLAKGDIVILLNTDVRPSKTAFKNCLRLFADPEVFAVTFNSGEAWAGAKWEKGMFHHFKVEPNAKNKNQLNFSLWASGGQAAFDKKKWLALGGMDLLYKPFYWEDVDLGYRAWKRGWKIIWDPQSKVVHDHQKSVIASNFSRKYITDTAQRNQFLFIWKNIHNSKLLASHLLRLPLFAFQYPIPFFRAVAKLPQVLSKRNQEKRLSKKTDVEILSLWQK